MFDKNERPTAKYVRNEKQFVNYLSKQYDSIAKLLMKELELNPNSTKAIRQAEIMKQIQFTIGKMDKPMHDQIEKYIKEAFMDGQAYHKLSIGDAKSMTEALKAHSWNKVNLAKVKALTEDTYKDILLATQHTQFRLKRVIRDAVADVAQYHALLNTGYKEQADQLAKTLVKQGLSDRIVKDGFVGVVDKKGRRWNLNVYSKMVIKTKVNDAFKEGVIQEAEESGLDLAVISDHSAEDACNKWEGVVVSMTGATEGYPTYKEARGSNQVFHPNCEHTLHPIRSLNMLHEDDVKLAKKKAKDLGYKVPDKEVKRIVPPTEVNRESIYKITKRTDTNFYQKIGEGHYNNIHNILDKAPISIKKVWEKYEDKIIAVDMNKATKGAYYNPATRGVHMNLELDSKGKHFTTPYQVTYHEFAHNIDFLVNEEVNNRLSPFSYAYENNKFGKSLQGEFDELVKGIDKKMRAEFKANKDNPDWLYKNGYISEMNAYYYKEFPEEFEKEKSRYKYTKAKAYEALQAEIREIPLMERGNLSDIMEGASKFKVRGGVGHGKEYWKREDNLPCEAFAEMIDSNVANKPALKQIQKYFPKSYEVFEEMLQFIINKQ